MSIIEKFKEAKEQERKEELSPRPSTALVPTIRSAMGLREAGEYAKVFMASGLFKDVKSLAQAQVKILYGNEIGLGPFSSMNMIEINEGKVELKPVGMRSQIRKHGKYDYEIVELTNEACVMDFFRLETPFDYKGAKHFIGRSSFTEEDAKKAQLHDKGGQYSMYKKYPRNMLISRATSNGVRWFCPDVFEGEVYYGSAEGIPGELHGDEAIDASYTVERGPAVTEAFEKSALFMSADQKQAYTAMYYDDEATDDQIIIFLDYLINSTPPSNGESNAENDTGIDTGTHGTEDGHTPISSA
jgi:hypothetical protein